MSRCFPFPPPGYEKKPTTGETDLLKKEKRQEKKHKKDKKDKERKDRSEGKHKDKKDRKDKHRDKKKDKDRDKEKGGSSSDKKPSLQLQNGEYDEQIQKKEASHKGKNSSSDDKRSPIQFHGENGELVRNRIKAGGTENCKFVQELDRRIKNEEKGTGSHQFVVEGRKNSFNKVEIQKTDGLQAIMRRNTAIENKINGTAPPPLDTKIDRRIEQKEKIQEKGSDDKRGDKRKNKDTEKKEKSKEKSKQKKAEREKNKHIKKNDSIATLNNLSAHPPQNCFQGNATEGNLKKRKDLETNGVSHENEPRPNKMARYISNISPENGRKLDSLQNRGSSLLDKQGASQGPSQNGFKVGSKDQRVNGMIASQPVSVSAKKPPISSFNHLPSKPSPIKSPPVITNNHVTVQSSPIHTSLVSTTKSQHVADQRPTPRPPPPAQQPTPRPPPPAQSPPPPAVINKVAAAPPLPIPKKKPPAATEPLIKPPHPDTKYLNQILTIPKLEPWCGFDDQEWLFSGKSCKKATMEEVQDPVQVWSEAKHIESVDVCALPYVIPY